MTIQFYVEYGDNIYKNRIELHCGPAGGDPSCATMVHLIRCQITGYDTSYATNYVTGDDVTLTSVTMVDYSWFVNLLRTKSSVMIPQIVACFMKKNSWFETKWELNRL